MKSSSVYDKLQSYNFDNYENFVKSINDSYHGLAKVEYVINNEHCPEYEYELISSSDLHDRFIVNYKNVRFDCLITPYNKTKISKLFVIFSGSRNPNKDFIPMFKRWSYYEFIDAIVLNIADPMFNIFEDLSLGWYYGTKSESYIEYLSQIIIKISSLLNIGVNDLYLFGSSGGGYVALQLSMYIKNATHIVINPQISINRFHYAKEFTRITGINLNDIDVHCRNQTINIIKDNVQSNSSKYLIIQNLQEKYDCTNHLFPLLNCLNIHELNLGLNYIDNMTVWLYSCIGGHNTQGDQIIFSYIMYLAKKVSKSSKFTDFDNNLIKNVSILWRQIEWYKYRISELSDKH